MSDEELAVVIMCPYDTFGEELVAMPCAKEGNIQEYMSPGNCKKCCIDYLKREYKPESAAGKDK